MKKYVLIYLRKYSKIKLSGEGERKRIMNLVTIDSKLMILLMKLEDKEYFKLEELAQYLEVSTRTIRNYIKQLNEILAKDIAQVENNKYRGYRLLKYDKEKFEEIRKKHINDKINCKFLITSTDRSSYIIKKFISEENTFKTDDLAEELNVSRTTLINDLKKIAHILTNFNIQIKGKTNDGISLQGNEINKRLFFIYFLCKGFEKESMHSNNWTFISEDIYKDLESQLIDLFKNNNYKISDEVLRNILSFIMILLVRIKQQKYIKKLDEKHKELIYTDDFKLAQKIGDLISKKMSIGLSENEVIYLTLPLMGRYSPVKNTDSEIKITPAIKRLVGEIRDEIYNQMGLDISEDKDMCENLKYHLNFAINRIIFNLPIHNPLIEDIKRYYPFPYTLAKVAAKIIEDFYGVKVIEDEVGYIALHFGSYVERRNNKYYSIKNIALICGTGIGTAKLLDIKLRKLLGDNKKIDTYSDLEVSEELLNNYDIIFTTVDIHYELKPIVIKLNAIFSDSQIVKEIERKYNLKNSNTSYEGYDKPFIHLSIPQEQFFIIKRKDYVGAIDYMVTNLSEVLTLDKDFKKRLIERENKSPTAFDNYVGLPHAVNYGSDKFSISMGVLEEPMVWGKNEVRLIIMLIVPDENSIDPDMVISVYEEILKICQNKKFIEELCKVRSYKEFLDLNRKERF